MQHDLKLDREALVRRQKELYKSVAAVAEKWPGMEECPHRSTLLRWFRGVTLPQSKNEVLSLAGALDLDPWALWAITPELFEIACERVLSVLRGGQWHAWKPAYRFAQDFVRSALHWPPEPIAKKFFGRPWHKVFRSYAAEEHRDRFQTFAINGDRQHKDVNQIWHFAWRPAKDARWRPYGFVHLTTMQLRLYSFSGWVMSKDISGHLPASIGVETWLGRGAADFCIASLHPFTLTEVADSNQLGNVVRFER